MPTVYTVEKRGIPVTIRNASVAEICSRIGYEPTAVTGGSN